MTPVAARKPKPRPKKRQFSDPGASYAQAARALSAGAGRVHARRASPSLYGRPTWERRLDPTSELILTILTQNSADMNAEVAFEALREAYPSGLAAAGTSAGRRLGRRRAARRGAAGLGSGRVRADSPS